MRSNLRVSRVKAVFVAACLAFAAMLLMGHGQVSAAQQPTPQAPSATDQDMMTMHQNMMAMRQTMMADDEAAGTRLRELVAQMHTSDGEAKIAAMAALLTELTEQH